MPQSEQIVIGQSHSVKFCETSNKVIGILKTKKRGNQQMTIEQDLLNCVHGLQLAVSNHVSKLQVKSVHHRNGFIFRASAEFHSEVWRDWATFDWGEEGNLPCHLLGFVDFSELPAGFEFNYAGSEGAKKGVYAIVECASLIEDEIEINKSELFIPVQKQIGGHTNDFVSHRNCWLADCDAIVSPVAVVPNLGEHQNGHSMINSRANWKIDFERWLDAPTNEADCAESDTDSEADDDRINCASDGSFDS